MSTLRAVLLGLLVCLGGCLISAPPGEPVYDQPAYVGGPPVSVWVWSPWPHYEVEHNYVVNNDRVIIRDRHYTPFARQTHRYIHQDREPHRGWYRHH